MKFPERKSYFSSIVPSLFLSVFIVAGSVLTVFASGGEAHADPYAQLKDYGYRMLNFIVLAALLFWAAKKADLKGILNERRAKIAKALQEAEEARDEAERKLAEYGEKLEKATREIDDIQRAIKEEAEAERVRIIAEAKETAERIKEQAKISAEQEIGAARARLRAETARLSVQLAEATLSRVVSPADQDKFVDEYLSKVVEA